MKTSLSLILLIFVTEIISAQKLIIGTEVSLVNTIKIKNDVIDIDTNFYNGNKFYITELKLDSKIDGPALYAEYYQKSGWFAGLRSCYSSVKYTSYGNGSIYTNGFIVEPDELKQRYLSYRLYLGKQFLPNKTLHPYLFIGTTRYHYFYHKFYNKTSATLSYNFDNYEKWLKNNFSSFNTISIGGGFSRGPLSIGFYHDQSFKALNSKIQSVSYSSYCTMKYNFVSFQTSKKIPLVKSVIETSLSERAFVAPTSWGLSIEHPISINLELAKDTVTGFNYDDGDWGLDDDACFVDGYIFGGFTMVEVRKKPVFKFSPTITLYREKSVNNSLHWFSRNAIGYRFFRMIFENQVTNYDTWQLFFNNNPDQADLSKNILNLKNEYSVIAQEHKIGYRFIRGSRPNYLTLHAGVRINWRVRHWNSFTSRLRLINPTMSAGVNYKINRFSFGINAEQTFLPPDKNRYYKKFYSINGQINFDFYRP